MSNPTKDELLAMIDEMEETLCYLESKISTHKIKPEGRKQVEILRGARLFPDSLTS